MESLLGLAGKSLSRTTTGAAQPWRKIVDTAARIAIPGILIIASLTRQPVVFTTDDQPAACTDRREIRYCVHADNQTRLAELVRDVDPMIARFGTKPNNLNQVWDQALTRHPIDTDLARGLEIAWLNPDGTIQTQVAAVIAGVYACASAASADQERQSDIEGRTQVAADISNYLSTGTPSGTLATMPLTDVRQWITHHQQQLHTCTLTPDQLPKARTR